MISLLEQLKHELKRFNAQHNSITSVFIGGGTPSTVDAELYRDIFCLLDFYLKDGAEITTEANPNSASESWLKGMKQLGCTRVSFGVQSFNDTKLKFLGREHNASEAIEAVKRAKNIGYKHISLDLMYATKMDTKEILQDDIKTAFSLPIDHISAYALTIEENTLFEAHPEVAKERLELSNFFVDTIKENGFEQYEISNFGKYRCQHNIGYWKLENYMGVGSGAVGMLDNVRYYPTTDIEDYIKNPLNIKEEFLHVDELQTERLFLGLRSCVGVDKNILSSSELKQANLLTDEKKLVLLRDRFYNPDFFISDEIALFLQT